MESIPRITRAQPMDALSSQATVSGYKAVLLAAERLPKFFPMLMTAAGTVAPAKVLVLGAGVAGLQAIATARRLGAVVTGFDVRPVVREQVESLGANLLDLGIVGEETAGGYAARADRGAAAAAAGGARGAPARVRRRDHDGADPRPAGAEADPGERRRGDAPGSVIVDLAAEAGGNCELTEPGEERRARGRDDRRPTNLPSTMPFHASQLYARNVIALLQHLAPEGELALDWDDEITAGACVTRKQEVAGVSHDTLLVFELTILVLAIFLGFEVISKVPTLLHTPLMSGTNAIHGIVIVGAMIVARARRTRTRFDADRRLRRRRARLGERRRRLRRHRPHARDVQAARAREGGRRLTRRPARRMSTNLANLLYLVTIVSFILALRFLSQPGARAARQPDRRGRDARRDRRHLRSRSASTSYWAIVARDGDRRRLRRGRGAHA